MRKTIFLLSLSLFFMACNSTVPAEKGVTVVHYFDLKGYMAKEAERLNTEKPEILKTVMVNAAAESKKMKISDWAKEMSVFSDADINKSAWQGMFKVVRKSNEDIYSTSDDKIPVKSLVVTHHNGRVKSIKVLLNTTNILYSSNDTLSYFPDSLYEIQKTQHIKLLSEKNYRISGLFIK